MRIMTLPPIALLIVLAACDRGPAETTTAPVVTAGRGCGPTLLTDAEWYASGKAQQLFRGLDGLTYPISIDPSPMLSAACCALVL